MTWLFCSPREAFEVHAYPNKKVGVTFKHDLSPFPMCAVYLESKLGVREIFWSHFQLLKQVFLAHFGSWGVI